MYVCDFQTFQQPGNRNFILPGNRIPQWFQHCNEGQSVSFWVRKEFPAIVVGFVVGVLDYKDCSFNFKLSVRINGTDQKFCRDQGLVSTLAIDHIFLCDLQSKLRMDELEKALLQDEWNHVEVLCMNDSWIRLKGGAIKWSAIHVYNQENGMDMENIRFSKPHSPKRTFHDLWNNVLEPADCYPLSKKQRTSANDQSQLATKNQHEQLLGDKEMEEFYDSLDADPSGFSPSEETWKALETLKDLTSRDFSDFSYPGHYRSMRTTLDYLSNLSADGRMPVKMSSLISQVSRDFSQWCRDYFDAGGKIELSEAKLLKMDKIEGDLGINRKHFEESEASEKEHDKELVSLVERSKKLEDQMNTLKVDISNCQFSKDMAINRKREIYEEGKILKVQRDESRRKVGRYTQERESAKEIQVNIKTEWSKLGEKFKSVK